MDSRKEQFGGSFADLISRLRDDRDPRGYQRIPDRVIKPGQGEMIRDLQRKPAHRLERPGGEQAVASDQRIMPLRNDNTAVDQASGLKTA